ncbi:MAG: hypothetical protein IPJ00_20455 [Saprospirales bacterium]|nr:hypothetical protein [Saprospirales bacterium]
MASLVTTKRYISSLDFMDQRALLRQLLNITNEETSFMDVMEMLGREVPVEMPKYSNFINSELYATDTIVSFTDTSGGSGPRSCHGGHHDRFGQLLPHRWRPDPIPEWIPGMDQERNR